MGIFSRSSRGHHYKNGNQGSNYYQRKGFLDKFINMMGSRSRSNSHTVYYPPQYDTAPSQPATICSKCNSRIPSGSKFCLECGEMVRNNQCCAACGQMLPPNAKFCLKCGKKTND